MPVKKIAALWVLALALLPALLSAPVARAGAKGWELIIDEGSHSMATSVAVLPDKTILVGGTTCLIQKDRSLKWYAWIKRLDAHGKLIWRKQFENGASQVTRITMLPSGNYVFYGHMRIRDAIKCEIDQFPRRVWFVQMTPSGKVVWDRIIGKQVSNDAASIVPRPGGEFILTGSATTHDCKIDGWLAWLDAAGKVIKEQYLGKEGGSLDIGSAVELSGGGILAVASHTFGDGAYEEFREIVVRFDDNGSVQWEHRLGKGQKVWAKSTYAMPDGCAMLAGYERQLNAGPEKMLLGWLAKINAAGKILWKKTFPLGIRHGRTGPFLGLPNGDFIMADEGSYLIWQDHNAALTQITGQGGVIARQKIPIKGFSSISALAYSPDDFLVAVGERTRKAKAPVSQWIMKIPLPLEARK